MSETYDGAGDMKKYRLFLILSTLTLVGCDETYVDRYNREVTVEDWVLIQPPPGHDGLECWRSRMNVVCFPREG